MNDPLEGKVREWLGVLGCTPKKEEDVEASWHLIFNYPSRTQHVMHLARPKGERAPVVIASRTNVDPPHIEQFNQLDDEGKEGFLWQLRRTLNSIEVDFQVDGITGPLSCPSAFQLSVARFEDGLTLDSFARSVGAVFKTELSVIWVFQEHFKPGNGGRGPRFDFKKFGF